jgi:hypothetical protein
MWLAVAREAASQSSSAKQMPQFLNDTAHWKLRAEEARQLAENLGNPEAKASILKIASEYDNLALRAAERLLKPEKPSN